MPFSKAWRESQYADYKKDNAYVDYKALKEIMHHLKEDVNPSTPEMLYAEICEQKRRTYEWCQRKVDELARLSRTLTERSEHLDEALAVRTDVGNTAFPVMHAKLACDAILYETLRLQELRNLNADTTAHIIGRMKRYSPLRMQGKWTTIDALHNAYDISLDEIFYLLSVVYERVTQAEETKTQAHSKVITGAIGSQVFDRRSVKYWVHKQDLPFVIARVIRHLPLSTIKDTYKESKEHNRTFKLGQQISSVYFENNHFLFYHRRLERLEGSSLIRIRWYTDSLQDDHNVVNPQDTVFVEMKVHHEAWGGDRSTKRRFALKDTDVDSYLRGELSLDPAVEKLRGKKVPEKEVNKFKDLVAEILEKVHAYDLKPALRTQCTRAAFQRGQDQSVRVSIDTNLRMSAEDFGLGHHWRVSKNDDQPHVDFPYAVVEVKLQCAENERLAPWIEELLQCRHMESVPKFSKYAHGIAAIYGHTPRIDMVPYWIHQMHTDIRAATKPEVNQWDPTIGLAVGCWERTRDRLLFGRGPAQTPSLGAAQAQFLGGTDYATMYVQLLLSFTGVRVPQSLVTPQPSIDARHNSYTKYHLYPLSTEGYESVCFGALPSLNYSARVLTGTIPWQVGKRIKVPQKYDPKTLLTSERYLLNMVERGSLLSLLGIGSISLGRSQDVPLQTAIVLLRPDMYEYFGIMFVCLGLGVMLYSMFVFRSRTLRVYARRKIRYDDVRGPTAFTILTIIVFAICLINMVLRRYSPMLFGNDDL